MQFKVPQFIDVEDKIFGPLTWKQFLYLAGGAGVCFFFFRILPLWAAIPLMLPFAALSLSLTFLKINERPFPFILQAYISYALQNKLYIWKQRSGKKIKEEKIKEEEPIQESKFTESKLRDLSWSLNVLDKNKNGK